MKRTVFLAILLPLCIEGQVIKFRKEAVAFFDKMKPAYIMLSNTNTFPDFDRIMKERKENRILLAVVETSTDDNHKDTTLKKTNDAEEKGIQIFGFEDTADIDTLAADHPKAVIYWCYLNDNDD